MSAGATVNFDWEPPDIPYRSMEYPIRYGPWLLGPISVSDWLDELETPVRIMEAPPAPTQRPHPLYRAPTVPDDWVGWEHGWHDDPVYFPEWAYEQHFRDADGRRAITILGMINTEPPCTSTKSFAAEARTSRPG